MELDLSLTKKGVKNFRAISQSKDDPISQVFSAFLLFVTLW